MYKTVFNTLFLIGALSGCGVGMNFSTGRTATDIRTAPQNIQILHTKPQKDYDILGGFEGSAAATLDKNPEALDEVRSKASQMGGDAVILTSNAKGETKEGKIIRFR